MSTPFINGGAHKCDRCYIDHQGCGPGPKGVLRTSDCDRCIQKGYSNCVITPNRPKRVDGPRQSTGRVIRNSSTPAVSPSSSVPVTQIPTTAGKSSGRRFGTRIPKYANPETDDEDEHASSGHEPDGSSANAIQEEYGDEEYEGRTAANGGKTLPGKFLPRLVCTLQDYTSYLTDS